MLLWSTYLALRASLSIFNVHFSMASANNLVLTTEYGFTECSFAATAFAAKQTVMLVARGLTVRHCGFYNLVDC